MGRTAVAVLSTENLWHNVSVIRAQAPRSHIIAMVKANAYGHGIRSVASRLCGHVDVLGVASIDEALALRQAGVKTPIMLAEGVFERQELIVASTEKFHVVFHCAEQVEWLSKSVCPLPLTVWVKVNTGMGRLGFTPEDALTAFERLGSLSQVKTVHILSHFACADTPHHPLNAHQIQQFDRLTQTAPVNTETKLSLCNSAAIFAFSDYHHDYVRPGLALYGVSPFADKTAADLGLKPVMTVQTSLISIQHYKKGQSIGYGARYTCPEDMPVGVIAFGYGDGYPITAQDGTPVLVNGVKCPLVGRVSMDMMTVDLRPIPRAHVGDTVVLWGESLPIEEVVAHTNNITWDLLTGVQNRVKFLWTSAS